MSLSTGLHANHALPVAALPPTRQIAMTLFCEFSVSVDGKPIDAARWKFKHPRLLWQMLCLAPGHRLSRDEAAEALWPQASVKASSNRLYHALHTLRAIFSDAGLADTRQLVQLQAGTLWLQAGVVLDIDVRRFAQAVAAARACNDDSQAMLVQLEAAQSIVRGDLVVPAAAGEWFAPHRQALQRERVWMLEQLARRYQEGNRLEDAARVGQALVQAEPSNEAAHQRLIELYEAQGRPDLAAQQYTACSRYLRRDLGIEPSASTRQLVEGISAQAGHRRAQQRPADTVNATPAKAAARRFTAPPRATPLLGRDAELAELQQWLLREDGSRLITITAAGGIGKTRLAAALAEQVQDHFADGVHFIALGDLQRAARLAEHVCQALALPSAGQPAEQVLAGHLAARHLLLVLDRFEHLVEAAPQLAQWLQAAPRLHIVVTSQCALRSRAERAYELPALWPRCEAAAVELFVRTAAHAGVQLEQPRDELVIRRVCERIGGNALAIELAAAQLAAVPLAALPAALEEPLQLLVGTSADDEPQHASLQATIGWSVSLLAADESQLLAMLSVFAGDVSSDDVQAVLGSFFGSTRPQPMLRTLLERHLLLRRAAAPDGQLGRLAMADAVRAHAQRAAATLPTRPATRAAHAQHFANVAAAAVELMQAGQHGQSRRAYMAAAADIELSLQWHRQHADTLATLRLSWKSGYLHASFGVMRDGIEALEWAAAVVAESREERDQSAWCHYILARINGTLGHIPTCVRWLRGARTLAKGSQDHRLVGLMGVFGAAVLCAYLRLDQATRMIDEVIRSTRLLDAASRPNGAYNVLAGCCLVKGDYGRAALASTEALDEALASRDSNSVLWALTSAIKTDLALGHLDRAAAAMGECRVLLEAGSTNNVEVVVRMLDFYVAFERAEYDVVPALLAELMTLCRATMPSRVIAVSLANDFVLMQTGRFAQVQVLRTLGTKDFPFGPSEAETYVHAHAYALMLHALESNWRGVGSALDRLRRVVRGSANALWGAWLAQSAAVAAQCAGMSSRPSDLLGLSPQLLASRHITPTPRQLGAWQTVESLLRSVPSQQGAPAPQRLIAALESLGPELSRWCGLDSEAAPARTPTPRVVESPPRVAAA